MRIGRSFVRSLCTANLAYEWHHILSVDVDNLREGVRHLLSMCVFPNIGFLLPLLRILPISLRVDLIIFLTGYHIRRNA